MQLHAIPFEPQHVFFVDYVFAQNIDVLHGNPVSHEEWNHCLCVDPDHHEKNFMITADGELAAWLKLNGLNKPDICISMLVVADEYKRKGIGIFAVQFAENYAREHNKASVAIQTTQDNTAATNCYFKQGYLIEKKIRYAVGDGVTRDGYQFHKVLEVNR